jgi:hypothetical protein
MGKKIQPRRVVAGAYKPSTPRTGEDDGAGSFRMDNMLVVGRGRYYWETYAGEGDLNENLDMVALTGTLTLTANSTTITGTGTLFYSECHLGQAICAITADNSNSWELRPKRIISDTSMEAWKAPDASATGVTGWRMPRLYTINTQRGTSLTGNALKLDKGSFIGAGSGVFRVDGSLLTASWTLDRAPSLALFDPATETYTNFPLGMGQPTGITAAAVAGGTKDMQAGSYSLVVARGRKQTGGYNNPSERIDVTIAAGDKIRITFPAMDTAVGQSSWPVWVTPFQATLGADLRYLEGPWHFYIEITDDMVSAAGGTFDIEYYDAEVMTNELASFNNDPPTDAEFVALFNNAPVYISCQGQGAATNPTQTSPGPFIVPAKPNNIEAAPLELAFSSSPPETIIGVVSGQGRLYLLTFNHLQIAQATPDQSVPILIRPYWVDGFANPDQLILREGMLYGYTMRGPTRSDENDQRAETDWTADVAEIMNNWNPGHVVVGYDPFRDLFVCIHSSDARNEAGFWTSRMLGFSVSQDMWAFDRRITNSTRDQMVSGIATVAEHLELLKGGRVAP